MAYLTCADRVGHARPPGKRRQADARGACSELPALPLRRKRAKKNAQIAYASDTTAPRHRKAEGRMRDKPKCITRACRGASIDPSFREPMALSAREVRLLP
jgi:hypothetical protein